ncbi:MAG: type II toxin-antitoxin system VapB family antitoxin [Akkermansiaceae bacterium]|nr:type II toxin-antitoxin system VapB family antitoxin [Akkermansiaceae bacterium]NNM28165.1 type II toxin-antitoxin system VapB family antitoxin [Akkermansiaceae bacterium]
MRTTLVINDELFAEAKRVAAVRQCSLSEIVNEALRVALKPAGRVAEAPPFRMLRFRGEGGPVDTSPAELSTLEEGDERDAYRP